MRKIYLASDEDYFDAASPDLEKAHARARETGFQSAMFQLGESREANPPVVTMLALPPGGILYRHCHDCYRMEVVVQGSMQMEDGVWLHPGDVRLSKPGEYYGPHTAGPTGVLSAEIFSATQGLRSKMDPAHPAPKLIVPEGRRSTATAGVAGEN